MLVRVFNQVQDISQVADELEKRIEDADAGSNDSVWLYPDEEIIIEEGEEANEQNNRQ